MVENEERPLIRAMKLLAKGDFIAARALLSAAHEVATRQEAELLAQHGALSRLESRFSQAAGEFAAAANLVRKLDPALHREYTDKQAAALADLAKLKEDAKRR